MVADMEDDATARAAQEIGRAEALVVAAGAGMGVDSGLPDFRGDQGFWKAYPPYAALGLTFSELANPHWFERDPQLAWGFYGHRLNLYRATQPHAGFAVLARWAQKMRSGAFVYTSNVDGQFQRAGFRPDRIVECHGAIQTFQCLGRCSELFPAPPAAVTVDPATFRAEPPLPACPRCERLARPNILMFGDGGWDQSRTLAQDRRMKAWLASVADAGGRMVIVECGAGTAVPSVRLTGEHLARRFGATLIRINPRESEGPAGTLSIRGGARETIETVDRMLNL
jgi:NAD-dependent SIR2 family protein deacetylase